MMGGNPGLDNGEWMMRHPPWTPGEPILNPLAWGNTPTPGERPEPEDTTGLKMLEEFLAKRKGERDGNGDER
jgi:hypothetical protein